MIKYNSNTRKVLFHSFFLIIFCSELLIAQSWQYPGCPDVTSSDFRLVELVNKTNYPELHEPMELAFDMDATGNVGVYFIERGINEQVALGKVNRYDTRTQTRKTIGSFMVYGTSERGIVSIATHPNFNENRWLYIHYHPAESPVVRTERFTLDADYMMDLSTRLVVFEFPDNRFEDPNHQPTAIHNDHVGGSIAFDEYGDLWITVGENFRPANARLVTNYVSTTDSLATTESRTASTHNFWGTVLRIHPNGDGTYSIPENNFGEYFHNYYSNLGETARAQEYLDPIKVLPEIYALGFRNPFTITLDPVRRWHVVADCGPQHDILIEEHNLGMEPAFYGWPYFTGKNDSFYVGPDPSNPIDPANPQNLSPWNHGIVNLPPATPAFHNYNHACAIAGPIVRYRDNSSATYQMPPHLNRVMLTTDFNSPPRYGNTGGESWFRALTISEDGKQILRNDPIFEQFNMTSVIELEQGPDGALYVINYGGWKNSGPQTKIYRIEYTGNAACTPNLPKTERSGCADSKYSEYDPSIPPAFHDSSACKTALGIRLDNRNKFLADKMTLHLDDPGSYTLIIRSTGGKLVYQETVTGPVKMTVPKINGRGLYTLEIQGQKKSSDFKILHF